MRSTRCARAPRSALQRALLASALWGCSTPAVTVSDASAPVDSAVDAPRARCSVPPGADPRVREIEAPPGWRCVRYPMPLAAPREVIETSSGDIVVTEQSSGRVVRVRSDRVEAIADGLSSPIGLREGDDRMLYVTEEGASALTRIDPTSGAATRLVTGLSNVTYLELTAERVAYVSSFPSFTQTGVVHRIDLRAQSPSAQTFSSGFYVAEGLALDPDGALVVAEWGGPGSSGPGRLTRIPSAGAERMRGNEIATGFNNIFGIHRAPDEGYLVSANTRIAHVHSDGGVDDFMRDIAVPSAITVTRAGDVLALEHVDINHQATGYLLRLSPP